MKPRTQRAVVVLGNFADGFTFVGPFPDFDAAAEAAGRMRGETWVAELHDPQVAAAKIGTDKAKP